MPFPTKVTRDPNAATVQVLQLVSSTRQRAEHAVNCSMSSAAVPCNADRRDIVSMQSNTTTHDHMDACVMHCHHSMYMVTCHQMYQLHHLR